MVSILIIKGNSGLICVVFTIIAISSNNTVHIKVIAEMWQLGDKGFKPLNKQSLVG